MSGQLFIHRVRLQAAERDYTWDFRPGFNVVVGPIGVGKTSLLELIKYGFGGDGVLTRTVQSVGRQVQLDVELADKRWVLGRGIGRSGGRVDVLSDDEQVASFAVESGPDEEGISDFLLEALDIPRLTLPRSRARPRDELTRISFRDVYLYLYLDQQEIDRSTAHDVDPLRNPKRQMTFELLYRLVDSKLAELRVAQVQADAALRRLQELVSNSRAFLVRLGQRSEEDLDAARAVVAGSIAEFERELRLLRQRARTATEGAVSARGDVAQVDAALRREQETGRCTARGGRSARPSAGTARTRHAADGEGTRGWPGVRSLRVRGLSALSAVARACPA